MVKYYYSKIQNFKQQIETHQQIHDVWLETAKHKLVLDNQQPQSQTHTLLITDSVTSKNFGVCGYPRNTTPELEKYSSSFKIFCQAFSPAASTIGALKMKLTEARHVVMRTLENSSIEEIGDWGVMQEKIRADLKRFLTKQTSRRPLILPVILEV
mgnify:CR=1 FL=1